MCGEQPENKRHTIVTLSQPGRVRMPDLLYMLEKKNLNKTQASMWVKKKKLKHIQEKLEQSAKFINYPAAAENNMVPLLKAKMDKTIGGKKSKLTTLAKIFKGNILYL